VRETIALRVQESSQIGEARRMATAIATRLGFDETIRGRVSIVITELATNLVKHAQNGQLLLQKLERRGILGLEVFAIDTAPGIENLAACLRDGYSTGGTSGNGLGAIQRLSDFFEIHSAPTVGTAILCRFWAQPLPRRDHPIRVGAVCLPKPGEDISGDAWAWNRGDHRSMFLVADGLGHGPFAADASTEAIRVFESHGDRSPKDLIERMHSALRSTRGAAIAIAEINLDTQTIQFVGVGNISASIVTPNRSQSLVSHNGTVGFEMRKLQEYSYPWSSDGVLVMHTDGLRTQWHLDRYPGLAAKHPSLIAGILYRDYHRDRDDVTVVVARQAI
jgi:anti-sigma regulatory factor (Ser/Thr protein kinase)